MRPGWDQSTLTLGEGRPANRETRSSGPGVTGMDLTPSFSSDPQCAHADPCFPGSSCINTMPGFHCEACPEATKAHGCLVLALTTPGPANRSGWAEYMDKRSGPCRDGHYRVGCRAVGINGMRLLAYLLALPWFLVWASCLCSQIRPYKCSLLYLRRPRVSLVLPQVCSFRSATMLMNAMMVTMVAVTQTPSAPILW